MARVLTSGDIDAAGGDPTARAQLAALQAILNGNANFFNSARITASDTPLAAPIFINGITSQFSRIANYMVDGGAGPGSGSFGTGILQVKFSNDPKGVEDLICKSRTATIGGAPVAIQIGDVIYTQAWYGDAGPTVGAPAGSMAHIGWYRVSIDGNPTGDSTELPGWYGLATGSGFHVPGSRYAMAINSKQQVHFPGAINNVFGPTGASWGANFTFGIGTSTAGGAPIKLVLTSAAILTVPEAGAFEWDATGLLYFTDAAAKRKQLIYADTTANTIAANTGAGTGPTVAIVNGPNCGRITVTTGSAPAANATIVNVTYGTAFPNDSFVTFSAVDANAAAVCANVRGTGNAAGFSLRNVGVALAAATTYTWEFHYGGK